jgi:hypothetical protein
MSQPPSCQQSVCYSSKGEGMEIYVNCASAGVFENGTAVSKSVRAQKSCGRFNSFKVSLSLGGSWYQEWKLHYIRVLQPY